MAPRQWFAWKVRVSADGDRAITGTALFAPTLAAAATLLAVHWLFSASAVTSRATQSSSLAGILALGLVAYWPAS